VFRVLIPSLFFAVIHLADEEFHAGRIFILMMSGILQSFAYLLTGNIWFTSGVHTGANFAAFSVTGLWHAGGVVALGGMPAYPNWVAVMLLMAMLGVAYFLGRWYKIDLDSEVRTAGK